MPYSLQIFPESCVIVIMIIVVVVVVMIIIIVIIIPCICKVKSCSSIFNLED